MQYDTIITQTENYIDIITHVRTSPVGFRHLKKNRKHFPSDWLKSGTLFRGYGKIN